MRFGLWYVLSYKISQIFWYAPFLLLRCILTTSPIPHLHAITDPQSRISWRSRVYKLIHGIICSYMSINHVLPPFVALSWNHQAGECILKRNFVIFTWLGADREEAAAATPNISTRPHTYTRYKYVVWLGETMYNTHKTLSTAFQYYIHWFVLAVYASSLQISANWARNLLEIT